MTAMIKMVGRGQPVPVRFQRSQLWPLLGNLYRKCHHISTENSDKLKIMFFGTDDFAVQSLARLHQECEEGGEGGCVSGLELTCLPMRTLVTAVAKFGWANNLKIHTWPPDIELIKQQHFDLGVVASFGKLVPRNIIQSFPLGMINVHGSLLPKYRGAAPVIHAIKNGDKKTGITIMRVRPHKFDVGEILASREVEIPEDLRRPELTSIMAHVGGDLLVEVLRNFTEVSRAARLQDNTMMSLAPLVDKSIARVSWADMTEVEVYNLWRAVGDLMKLTTSYASTGHLVRIATVLPPRVLAGARLPSDCPPGRIEFIRRGKKEKFVCVKCRTGWVAVSDIFYHNKKVMSPTDFYNGLLSKPGDHKFI